MRRLIENPGSFRQLISTDYDRHRPRGSGQCTQGRHRSSDLSIILCSWTVIAFDRDSGFRNSYLSLSVGVESAIMLQDVELPAAAAGADARRGPVASSLCAPYCSSKLEMRDMISFCVPVVNSKSRILSFITPSLTSMKPFSPPPKLLQTMSPTSTQVVASDQMTIVWG